MNRRRLLCVGLALVTIALGLVWRLVPLGMPAFAVKYGGSVLWAAMVYWLCAALLGSARTARIALLAAAIATAVECFKLVRQPALDAFRETLAGKLLLGRYFALADIAAYLLAIALVAAVDRALRRRAAWSAEPPAG